MRALYCEAMIGKVHSLDGAWNLYRQQTAPASVRPCNSVSMEFSTQPGEALGKCAAKNLSLAAHRSCRIW